MAGKIWRTFIAHWKLWGIPPALAAAGGVMKWFYDLRKKRADAFIAERALEKLRHEEELELLGKQIRTLVNGQKGQAKYPVFEAVTIAGALGVEPERVAEAMEHLQRTGHARKMEGTEYWHID